MNTLLSSIFGYFEPNPYKEPSELTHEEIVKYFKDPEYKDYMYGAFYEFMPPKNELDMQLMLIWRLFHLKYITYSEHTLGQIDCYPITTANALKYPIDSELLDPRNCEPPYTITHESALLKKFSTVVADFNWGKKIDVPDNIESIIIHNNDTNVSMTISLHEFPNITVKSFCMKVFPYLQQYWINTCKISSLLSENIIDQHNNLLTIQIYNHPHMDNNLYKNYMEEQKRLDDFINSGP